MPDALRKQTARILSVDGRHRLSRVVDWLLILLISLNVLAIILESVPSFHDRYATPLFWFEAFSVTVFSVEYVLRVWSSVELVGFNDTGAFKARLRYMVTPLALIDLLAIAPFYLSILFAVDLRFLRVIRLLRIFKLTRYSGAMNLLLSVFREEAQAFMAAFFVLLMLLILASSGIYLLEHEVQPDAFGSIPDAMWWAMATLTTVGYGDVVPITPLGKLFGGLITVIGIGMVALPAGILASGFADQVHRRRSQYEERLEQVLGDGIITHHEQEDLSHLRESLGLSQDEVEDLTHAYLKKHQQSIRQCPHCHKPLIQERRSDRSSSDE
ncbi:ion transporter [Reinekea blandensis]|uniref:Putative potassium channel protein n=1 Tax=Reinekea blandensis MED297 TaxID=314283 RepID=A4BIJ1_9GAMM|nr:ion transporter [Reinekea blandensis]EAR08070.1 putative potassium channel protein [Reinekea sp. MED297] [Reinekea blandensis MED297]